MCKENVPSLTHGYRSYAPRTAFKLVHIEHYTPLHFLRQHLHPVRHALLALLWCTRVLRQVANIRYDLSVMSVRVQVTLALHAELQRPMCYTLHNL